MRLDGKVAIVTGGGRGVGRALSLKLASEGATVVVNDLDSEPADSVVSEIKASGGDALAYPGDVTTPEFGDKLVETALSTFGDLHIVVNNAGYAWDAMAHKASDQQFDAMYEVHAKAPFRILRATSRYFRQAAKAEKAEGREVIRKIVNISSTSGFSGNVGQIAYSAMKAAQIGMTKTLAKELGPSRVCVNCVGFGLIETRMTQATEGTKTVNIGEREVTIGVPKQVLDDLVEKIPFGRRGYPEEAAAAVFLFCTPESDYISGQVVGVTGGIPI